VLRATAAEIDPALRLESLQPMDDVANPQIRILRFWFSLSAGMCIVALLLSLAGVYSVMAFTVARRTREIGIRVALGADRRLLVIALFRRPVTQVAAGVAAGTLLVAVLVREVGLSVANVGLVIAYAALMLGVCLLACVVPTVRALRVEPVDALRADG
jgi:ABC-type antimicrobial peptide transport system permease subunit